MPGTHLEIPGLEAILEYGDASQVKRDRIPRAMLINDHSRLDRARITQLDGLHDDPEGSETRQPNADRHGERAGIMLYRGRTIGLTGRVEAGNIGAMRNNWRRLRGQFTNTERDLLIHHPFEVRALVNEVINPSLSVDAAGWVAPSLIGGGGTASAITASVTDGIVKAGSMTVTSATTTGSLVTYGLLFDPASGLATAHEWEGEDVWITARAKLQSSSGGTVSSIAIGVAQWIFFSNTDYSVSLGAASASAASPSVGSWQTLAARVPATAIAADTTHVTPYVRLNYSAGTHTVRFFRCANVRIGPDEPSPVSYFDGDLPGFGWLGDRNESQSIGPTHAENQIADPRFEELVTSERLLARWDGFGTAATYAPEPTRSNRWSGDYVDGSLYVKATKIATSTTAFGVSATDGVVDYYPAEANRIYRLSAKLNTLQKPAGGSFNLTIEWMNEGGTVISTNSSEVIATGEHAYSVLATAPARTVAARVRAQMTGSTAAASVLEFFLSDPCFVDFTDWDPGDFYGVGDISEEVGNRRRIPRPFLMRNVRKTSDMKAPEQQSRSRAWRDFTMSLRAGDPRVYCLDERSVSLQLSSDLADQPQLVFEDLAPLAAGNPPITTALAGFTTEGQTGTTGWKYGFTDIFNFRPLMSVGGIQEASSARPAASALQRSYRSAEGYTYTHPRVIIHGHFQMKWGGFFDVAFGWNSAVTPKDYYYNTIGILLKRVSSTQWLELRVNSSSHDTIATFLGAGYTDAPYTVELWSSHNTSGSAAVTRLAQWDIGVTSGVTQVSDPSRYPMIIQAEIDDNNHVNVSINSTNNAGTPFTSLDETYAIPAGLLSLFGNSVAGHAGELIKSSNWPYDVGSAADWQAMTLRYGFPWISYFEASNSNVDPGVLQVPVIGDVETPQTIVLRGDLDGPIMQLNSSDENGETFSSTMRLNGLISDANPLIIDVAKKTIKDSQGINRYSMLSSGSLHSLRPGINELLVSGRGWTTYPNHVRVAWRDALL